MQYKLKNKLISISSIIHFLVELRLHYYSYVLQKLRKLGGHMKYLKYLVSIITAISISSVVTANEIKMAKADWDTGYFQAEIYKQALEKMGYKVTEPNS